MGYFSAFLIALICSIFMWVGEIWYSKWILFVCVSECVHCVRHLTACLITASMRHFSSYMYVSQMDCMNKFYLTILFFLLFCRLCSYVQFICWVHIFSGHFKNRIPYGLVHNTRKWTGNFISKAHLSIHRTEVQPTKLCVIICVKRHFKI